MYRAYTVGKNKVGYEFDCGSRGKVGDEVLVFTQHSKLPYGIANILKQNDSGGFKMRITEVFE